MRRRKQLLKQYLRFKNHILYVEKTTLELRSQICMDACLIGQVDEIKRTLYLKYNQYLVKLRAKNKTY